MNKSKRNVLLLILLLLVAGSFYYYTFYKKPVNIVFKEQGKTELSAGKITMKVYDHDAEDGDSIQVYFQNKMIADSLGILNTPVSYNLGNLSAGEYRIGVTAINEGMSSPASAYIVLSDGKTEKEFSMDAWKDSAAGWKVTIK